MYSVTFLINCHYLLIILLITICILKTSQHPGEAKAFIDYVLSPEGQAKVADAWLMPARRDVAAKRPLLDALKVLPTTSEGSSERGAVLARFSQLYAQ